MNCKNCNVELDGKKQNFCSQRCKSKFHRENKSDVRQESTPTRFALPDFSAPGGGNGWSTYQSAVSTPIYSTNTARISRKEAIVVRRFCLIPVFCAVITVMYMYYEPNFGSYIASAMFMAGVAAVCARMSTVWSA